MFLPEYRITNSSKSILFLKVVTYQAASKQNPERWKFPYTKSAEQKVALLG